MNWYRILIIGKGHVGTTLGEIFEKKGYEVEYHDPNRKIFGNLDQEYFSVHICYPMKFRNNWVFHTRKYISMINTRYFVVEATIIPGVLKEFDDIIGKKSVLVYSPIRATEAIMKRQLQQLHKLWAIYTENPGIDREKHIQDFYKNTFSTQVQFKDAEALVLGKLLEVTWFGLNIAFTQHVKRLCKDMDINFDEAYTEYTKFSKIGYDYNDLIDGAPKRWIDRPILRPDVIGGNCVIQDVDLLGLVDGSVIWDWVKWSNEQTKMDLKREMKK